MHYTLVPGRYRPDEDAPTAGRRTTRTAERPEAFRVAPFTAGTSGTCERCGRTRPAADLVVAGRHRVVLGHAGYTEHTVCRATAQPGCGTPANVRRMPVAPGAWARRPGETAAAYVARKRELVRRDGAWSGRPAAAPPAGRTRNRTARASGPCIHGARPSACRWCGRAA